LYTLWNSVSENLGKTIVDYKDQLAGERGDEFADLAGKTVGNVVKGIPGVAFIQSFLGQGFPTAAMNRSKLCEQT
jgi:hypothetical protein